MFEVEQCWADLYSDDNSEVIPKVPKCFRRTPWGLFEDDYAEAMD